MKTYEYGKKGGIARGLGLGAMHSVLFLSWALLVWFTSITVQKNIANGGESFTTMLNVVIAGLSLGQAAPDISAFLQARVVAYPIFEMIERNTLSKSSAESGKLYLFQFSDWPGDEDQCNLITPELLIEENEQEEVVFDQVGEILGTLIKPAKSAFLPLFDELASYITPM